MGVLKSKMIRHNETGQSAKLKCDYVTLTRYNKQFSSFGNVVIP